MSVASEIQRIKDGIASVYSQIDEMGGELPQTQNLDNLTTAVSSISSSSPIYYKLLFYASAPISDLKDINLSSLIFYGREYDYMFSMCTEVTTIEFGSASSSGVNQNFINCENMNNMFQDCASLTTITGLDKFNVSHLSIADYMFYGCPRLDNNTLNNILLMCSNINMRNYQGEPTLAGLGLDSSQIQTCHNLSNYSAAIANGWTDE